MYRAPQIRTHTLTQDTFGCKKKENPIQTGLNKNGLYWLT